MQTIVKLIRNTNTSIVLLQLSSTNKVVISLKPARLVINYCNACAYMRILTQVNAHVKSFKARPVIGKRSKRTFCWNKS